MKPELLAWQRSTEENTFAIAGGSVVFYSV